MKNLDQKNRLLLLIFIISVFSESVFVADCAAIAQDEHDHNHANHNSNEYMDISIKGYGEDCIEENIKCSNEDGLICFKDVGKCDCNSYIGLAYSEETGRCQETPKPDLAEFHDTNLLDEEEVATTTSTTTTSPEVPAGELDPNPVIVQQSIDHDHDDNTIQEKALPLNLCEHVNCEETLGMYSKCEESTGSCICDDIERKNRTVLKIGDRCIVKRNINDECSSHEECSATIKGNAWCHMDIVTLQRFCQCEIFNYFDEDLQECLPFAADGLLSPCKSNLQCTGIEIAMTGHGLGPNAICSPDSGNCECKLGPSNQKGFLYENYCFNYLKLGDQCHFDKECEIGLPGQDVFCEEESKTCACKNGNPIACPREKLNLGGRGFDNDDQKSTSDEQGMIQKLKSAMGLEVPNFVFIMIIAAVVLVAIVIISVFIVRKRHKYTVVRSHDTPDRSNK